MKKFLTIDDLIEFCMKNNFSKFSSKESNAEISVQMPAVATFGKSDDNKHTEGLCPFNATAYHDHVNLNKSNINEDTFKENTQSIPYRPILANIVENSDGNKDFGSHDFTVETDENGEEMNLREGEVNGFDIGTCRGMRQVMDMSNASILKQLRLDESEYSDMLAEQREMITKLRDDLDNYKEISRILLRENIDLKDYMEEHNLIEPDNLVDLNELFSCFSSDEEEETEVTGDDESGSDSRASEA